MPSRFQLRERVRTLFSAASAGDDTSTSTSTSTSSSKDAIPAVSHALWELQRLSRGLSGRVTAFDALYRDFDGRVTASIERADVASRPGDFAALTAEARVVDDECAEVRQDLAALNLWYAQLLADGRLDVAGDKDAHHTVVRAIEDVLKALYEDVRVACALWEAAREGYSEYRRLNPGVAEKGHTLLPLPRGR